MTGPAVAAGIPYKMEVPSKNEHTAEILSMTHKLIKNDAVAKQACGTG